MSKNTVHVSAHHQVYRLNHMIQNTRIKPPKLWLNTTQQAKAKEFLNHPTLAVAPTAQWIGKQWPKEYFTDVMTSFFECHEDADILLVGAPHEASVIQHIYNHFEQTPFVKRLKFLLSPCLKNVAAHMAQCDLFLGNDSGLMHMAAALNIPTIGLFGPSDERRYGPFGDVHTIIRTPKTLQMLESQRGFSYTAPTSYMRELAPSTVFEAVNTVWDKIHMNPGKLGHMPLYQTQILSGS